MTTLETAALKLSAPEPLITSVADIISSQLPSYGRRPAIRYDTGSTYKTLDFTDYVGNINRALQALASERTRQEIVCTFVKNRPEWDMVALATLYGGNILFPLDTKMHDQELEHLLVQSPPDVVLVSRASRERMKRLLDTLGIGARILIADLYEVFEDSKAPLLGDLDDREQCLSSVPVRPGNELPEPSERLDYPDLVLGHYATSGTT
ncbi:MAG: AMP-binding protein, partial [Gemmatimonadota bacterium]